MKTDIRGTCPKFQLSFGPVGVIKLQVQENAMNPWITIGATAFESSLTFKQEIIEREHGRICNMAGNISFILMLAY
jgi:hypothetical protein